MSPTSSVNNESWPWPDSLDALIAAPRHHKLIFENERMRLLDTRIPPGDVVPVHTHRWPAVYYTISPGDFIRRDGEGNLLLDTRVDSRPVGKGIWIDCLPPHSVENVGATEIHLISCELKQ